MRWTCHLIQEVEDMEVVEKVMVGAKEEEKVAVVREEDMVAVVREEGMVVEAKEVVEREAVMKVGTPICRSSL